MPDGSSSQDFPSLGGGGSKAAWAGGDLDDQPGGSSRKGKGKGKGTRVSINSCGQGSAQAAAAAAPNAVNPRNVWTQPQFLKKQVDATRQQLQQQQQTAGAQGWANGQQPGS